jgi:hypothetical protein
MDSKKYEQKLGLLVLTSKHMLPGVSKMSVICLRIKKLINHIGIFPITSLGKTDVGPKEDDKTQGFLDPYQSAGTCVSTPYPGPS